ncbi:hypothetical protein DTO271D3_2286 [Paecilomyces variotii]|nr:hypothetical protein DTO271D3_2286 [Paecilomyces variotii]
MAALSSRVSNPDGARNDDPSAAGTIKRPASRPARRLSNSFSSRLRHDLHLQAPPVLLPIHPEVSSPVVYRHPLPGAAFVSLGAQLYIHTLTQLPPHSFRSPPKVLPHILRAVKRPR